MLNRSLFYCLAFAFMAAASAPQVAGAIPPIALDEFPRSELSIDTQDGRKLEFGLWLALTQRQRAQGLMFVEAIPQDMGMLFHFEPPRVVSMWMKNTKIPLDMLFVRRDGVIETIAADAVPGSLSFTRSDGPVAAVLELAGGTAQRLGIRAGDCLKHEWFEN